MPPNSTYTIAQDIRKPKLTVLVDQHSYGYSIHVKSVEEVLYVGLHISINAPHFFQLHDRCCCLHHHVFVAISYTY